MTDTDLLPFELDAQAVQESAALGADEAHRQQDEVGRVGPLGAPDLHELKPGSW